MTVSTRRHTVFRVDVVDEGRHFIQKPFDMHSLNAKIKDALLGEAAPAKH